MTLASSWAALAADTAPISTEDTIIPEEKESTAQCSEEQGEDRLLPCLVADSAAFIRNVALGDLAHKIFTIRDVISEIRDPQTRQRLAVLPYEITYREPSLESIKFVTEFSKQTGDFRNLSAVDLRVLALTHQLESEFCDRAHIRAQPEKKTEIVSHSKLPSNVKMVGFYNTRKKKKDVSQDKADQTESQNDQPITEESLPNEEEMCIDDNGGVALLEDMENTEAMDNDADDGIESEEETNTAEDANIDEDEHVAAVEGDIDADEYRIEEDGVVEDDTNDGDDFDKEENDEDDGNEEGWITPKNIVRVKKEMGAEETDEQIDVQTVKCACLTTDFAMQNVLIQMGLHIVSVDGRLIRQARSYIQKCHGCHKETHDMTRVFCPMCGNKTLRRVAVSIEKDGTMQYHYPRRKKNPNMRGTKFSLPHPKGGRHGDDVITCEDQKLNVRNMPRAKDPSVNAMDPDYAGRGAGASPFTLNDTTSRAFTLGVHMRPTRTANPNASRKKRTGKRR